MLNFFHSIAGKIAVAISSFALLFSGSAATPHSPAQQATQGATSSVQVTQQTSIASTTGLSEIEQLRKEIKDLKSKRAPSSDTVSKLGTTKSAGSASASEYLTCGGVSVPKKGLCEAGGEPRCTAAQNYTCDPITPDGKTSFVPAQNKPQAISQNDEDQKVIRNSEIIYKAEEAANIRTFLDSIVENVSDMKSRRSRLAARISTARSVNFGDSHDGLLLNQMFSLYADQMQEEVDYIYKNIAYVEKITSILENYRNQAIATGNDLITNAAPLDVSVDGVMARGTADYKIKMDTYDGEIAVLGALSKYYGNLVSQEDKYAESYAILKSAVNKVSASYTAPAVTTYYQPLPATTYVPQIPKTIYCTLMPGPSGGMAYATVQCN